MPTQDILVTAPLPPFLYEPLKAGYRCHDHHLASHKPGLLAAEGARVRGLVQGGGTVTPTELLDQLPGLEIISVFGVGYDGVPVEYCRQRGIRGVRRLLHAKVVLLGMRDLALKVVDVTGPIEQVWVLHVEPERPMRVALAGCQAGQNRAIAGGHLEHRLRPRRITEGDAGAELGRHRVAHGRVRADNQGVDQRLRGFRQVGPREVVGHVQPIASQELTQRGVHRQFVQQFDPGFFHDGSPFRIGVGGLRTEGLGALAGD